MAQGIGEHAPLTILDGAMGHTLKQRGLSDSFAEAAFANVRQPELVTSVHREVRHPAPSTERAPA